MLLLGGVSLAAFAFAELAPGDFFSELQVDPRVSPETLARLRDQYGLDRPFAARYVEWLRLAIGGDLGFSIAYRTPVTTLIAERAANTLRLTITATIVAWLVAIPLGAWAAGRTGGLLDRLTSGGTTFLLATPDLLIGLAALTVAVRTGWFPTGGDHLALPSAALALTLLPVLVRHVRAGVAEALHAPFIAAARARGVSNSRLLAVHALRVAANPLISLFGLSISGLLSASVVIEVVMSWPGLGPLLLDAVDARDLHLVVGAAVCSTFLLLAGNVAADVLLLVADPRIRTRAA